MGAKGSLNEYSEKVFTVSETVSLLLDGVDISDIIISDKEEIQLFESNANRIFGGDINLKKETSGIPVEMYHRNNTLKWNFPQKYKEIDTLQYLLDKCTTEEEIFRVKLEHKMYDERNLLTLLQFMIYLVDHMREHKILWGVGRGSSVASLCLYLIGINRVNPLEYDLDINEFLK